jgi:hypothetical protein
MEVFMCHFCAETNMAFALGDQAETGVAWEPHALSLLPYLQETPDILAGCQQMARYDHDDSVCNDILVCRLMEMLVAHGLDSALCQRLLQHEDIQRALAHACRPEPRALARQCEAPFLPQGFLVFYDLVTYRNPTVWERLRAPSNALVRACRAAVRDFRDWWLRGHGVPSEECEEREIGGITLLRRPWSTADEAAQQRFRLLYRCWFISLCVLGRTAHEQTLLSHLLPTDPRPFAQDAPDLWLQRRAIVQLVRHGGVETLVPYNPAIRPQLVYYAALKAGLSQVDCRRLAVALGAVEAEQSAWRAELYDCQELLAV